jgi:Aspartyl protease/PDZ domain
VTVLVHIAKNRKLCEFLAGFLVLIAVAAAASQTSVEPGALYGRPDAKRFAVPGDVTLSVEYRENEKPPPDSRLTRKPDSNSAYQELATSRSAARIRRLSPPGRLIYHRSFNPRESTGMLAAVWEERRWFGTNDYFVLPQAGAVASVENTSTSTRLQQETATALHAERLTALRGWHEVLHGNSSGLPAEEDAWLAPVLNASAQSLNLTVFTQDTGFDGREGWTRDVKGVVWVEGNDVGRSLVINQNARDTYAIWGPNAGGAVVTSVGTREEKGATFDVLRFRVPGSVVPFDVWIDRGSRLPARYVESASGITTTTSLEHYQPFEGMLIPFVVHTLTNQGNPTEFTVQRIESNPNDLAERVRRPDSTVHDFSINGSNETTIPFDLIDNHVYLNVSLNGKGPYRFVFDTGAFNVMDPAVAREIGATAAGHLEGSGTGSASVALQFARVSSLKLGNAELHDQLFATLPLRHEFAVAAGAPFDGLIGWEVLARFVTSIDYVAKTVTLRLGSTPQNGVVIPFVFRGTDPQFACTIDEIASHCLVDTGSGSSLDIMALFVAAHPGVVPADATAPGMNAYGAGGGDIGRLGRLRSFEFGGFTLNDLVAGFSQATAGVFIQEGMGANVGAGVWKRFTMTFDYPRQTMTVAPNAAFEKWDEYERAGVYLIERDGNLIVVDVRPGTPAAKAGMRKDDVIATVDGKDASQITLGDLRSLFRRPAGTIVRFGVKRGSLAEAEIAVTLADYV